MIGKSLAQFTIIAKLGEGGMGEVYHAEDAKLAREVAIKVLPETVASNPERLARFEREAKVLASLNHPNIAAIYQVEEADGVHFLVMELAGGEDLAARLARGPIAVDEAMPIALQIASGLEAAHERGVVHRDLKPANVKLTSDGQVKVLDFGLAKALDPGAEADSDPSSAGPTASMSPTLTAQMTQPGTILGTAAYMSPEQAKGKEADKRSDIWAFGVLLYEMLVGERTFSGDSISETLAAVLRDPVDSARLPAETPAMVRRLVERCLERDPQRRLRDIGEARITLDDAIRGDATGDSGAQVARAGSTTEARQIPAASARARRGSSFALLGAVVVAAGLLGAAIVWQLRPTDAAPLRKLDIATQHLRADWLQSPIISPDGTQILYTQEDGLWVRSLDEVEGRRVQSAGSPFYLCWSPDSRQIGFFEDGKLFKVSAAGGAPTPVAELPAGAGGSGGLIWTEDGYFIIAGSNDAGLMRVAEQGGSFEEFVALNPESERDFHEVALLPGGRGLVFVVHRDDPARERRIVDTIEVFSDGTRKIVLRLEGEAIQSITYSPSGHLVYHQSTTTPGIWAVPFSVTRLEVTGDPFLVEPDAWLPSAARDGTLLFVRGLDVNLRQVVEVDRDGEVVRMIGEPIGEAEAPNLSPDGTQLMISGLLQGNWDIWLFDLAEGRRSRLTFDTTFESEPRWSPDGRRFAYTAADNQEIRLRSLDGSDPERTVTKGSLPRWLPGGEGLLFDRLIDDASGYDILTVDLDSGKERTVLGGAGDQRRPTSSTDGRLLAYLAESTGQAEVFISRLPGGEGKWQVSTGGAQEVLWSRDGTELFYIADGTLMAVELVDGDPNRLSRPRELFSLASTGIDYRVTGVSTVDLGSRHDTFLLVRPVESAEQRRKLVVVQNWYQAFQ